MLPLNIPLLAGTLKIKRYLQLRSDERKQLVPVFRFGHFYVVWRSSKKLH